jgi:thiol-disulfide isomerase/thioredoxin
MLYKQQKAPAPRILHPVILIFILFVLPGIYSSLSAQVLPYRLALTEWDFKGKGTIKITEGMSDDALDPADVLAFSAKFKLVQYKICKVALQKRPGETKHSFLRFLTGVSSADAAFIICDENRDGLFADNRLYPISDNVRQQNVQNPIPPIEISIDSIPLFDTNGGILYKPAKFRVQPVLSYNAKAINIISLMFIVTNYYPIHFSIGDISYEMTVYAHPVTQLFYSMPYLYWNAERLRYIIYRLKDGLRDSIVFFGGVLSDIAQTPLKYPLYLADKSLRIIEHNADYTSLSLEMSDILPESEAKPLFSEPVFTTQLKTGKRVLFADHINTPRLIFFGGSWCMPCKKVIPELKVLYKKYGTRVRFEEILVEYKAADGRRYLKENAIAWTTYVEYLDKSSENTLRGLFKVGTYPTFILLDKGNNIITRTIADGGLKEMEKSILSLL